MSFLNALSNPFKPRSNSNSTSNSNPDAKSNDASSHQIRNNNEHLHVEVITIKDYKKAAKTLQIAFKDDLYVNYLTSGLSDSNMKEQLDLALFEATTYSTILSGLVVGIRDLDGEKTDPEVPFLAVACFDKPHKTENKANKSLFNYLWSMYQGGYLRFVWLANKETRQRVFDEQWLLLEDLRKDVLDDDFNKSWYLSDIGAIPKGRGKGLARRLIDHVCHNYIDIYKPATVNKNNEIQPEDDDDDDLDIGNDNGDNNTSFTGSDENSKLDSEIQSFNFAFDLDSDNLTDYSGYSSYSDSDASSAHSSWYYNEEQDILTQYDQRKSKGKKLGAPLYLESSHPRNRKIYQKLGFTYVKTVAVADVLNKDGGKKTLTMDLMVRGVKGAKWVQKEDRPVT